MSKTYLGERECVHKGNIIGKGREQTLTSPIAVLGHAKQVPVSSLFPQIAAWLTSFALAGSWKPS